jgi:hypothetical protein
MNDTGSNRKEKMTAKAFGDISFYQACLPPLLPGKYEVTVDQTVKEVRENPFRTALQFSVAGPRFSLNPSDVYSVYPPAGQTGNFGNSLPHIVFTRRTIPWERTMDGTVPDDKNPCPWLALLLVSDSDFESEAEIPKIETRKVGEVLNPGNYILGPQEIKLNDYEAPDDICQTIDLPSVVFSKIVPAKEDLPYLAHVREVNTGNKETLAYLSEGCFSVVLGNRFPDTDTLDFSLDEFAKQGMTVEDLCATMEQEGYKPSTQAAEKTIKWLNKLLEDVELYENITSKKKQLELTEEIKWLQQQTEDDRSKNYSDITPDKQNAIKRLNRYLLELAYPEVCPASRDKGGVKNTAYLVSLEGFQDYLDGTPQEIVAKKVRLAVLASWSFFCEGESNFKYLMSNLSDGLLKMPLSPELEDVKGAFELGYTALNHHIRNGEKTVSWYRGPLVPLFYRTLETYEFLPCADAALRYNYNTGLLDVSYAAAWQLGRLLALQDQHFARTIYHYRIRERQKVKSGMQKKELEKKYELDEGKNFNDHLVGIMSSDAGSEILASLSGKVER